jgi:hypothetical protein
MQQCRRCNDVSVEVVRESISRRGTHVYTIFWFRCPHCQEVSLRYRRLRDLPDNLAPTAASTAQESSEDRAPALPRSD